MREDFHWFSPSPRQAPEILFQRVAGPSIAAWKPMQVAAREMSKNHFLSLPPVESLSWISAPSVSGRVFPFMEQLGGYDPVHCATPAQQACQLDFYPHLIRWETKSGSLWGFGQVAVSPWLQWNLNPTLFPESQHFLSSGLNISRGFGFGQVDKV